MRSDMYIWELGKEGLVKVFGGFRTECLFLAGSSGLNDTGLVSLNVV